MELGEEMWCGDAFKIFETSNTCASEEHSPIGSSLQRVEWGRRLNALLVPSDFKSGRKLKFGTESLTSGLVYDDIIAMFRLEIPITWTSLRDRLS